SRSSVNSRAPQEGRVDERIDSKFAGGIDTGAAEAHRSGVSQDEAAVDRASGLVAERCAVHQVPCGCPDHQVPRRTAPTPHHSSESDPDSGHACTGRGHDLILYTTPSAGQGETDP